MNHIRNLDTPSPADIERADAALRAELARKFRESDAVSFKVGGGWFTKKLSARQRAMLARILRGEGAER